MDNKEFAKIVSKNLKRIAYEQGMTQSDIVNRLHINKATVSSWFNGTRIPRMDKIDMLCEFFGCSRTDIMEQYTGKSNNSINNDEQRLLDAYREADPITRRNIRMLLGIVDDITGKNKIS